jgi:hypothetical protein
MELISWIIGILSISLTSLFLTLRSMKGYHEEPTHFKTEYTLYLVQNPHQLTQEVLSQLYKRVSSKGHLLAIEILQKGSKKAVVIYASRDIIQLALGVLNLIELEDYSNIKSLDEVSAWEVGSRKKGILNLDRFESIKHVGLQEEEQFWWQIVTQPLGLEFLDALDKFFIDLFNNLGIQKVKPDILPQSSEELYSQNEFKVRVSIRAVVKTGDYKRRHELLSELAKVGDPAGLIKLPQRNSTAQVMKYYQSRSLPRDPQRCLTMNLEELTKLFKV